VVGIGGGALERKKKRDLKRERWFRVF